MMMKGRIVSMREIKFRMFVKSLNEMQSNDNIKGACGGLLKATYLVTGVMGEGGLYLPTDDKDIVFMQYTGLKDKNGKEIYEGDIYNLGEKYVVQFNEDRAGFFPFAKDDGCGCCSDKTVYDSDAGEILGNIYENPELIGGEETCK
jgi:uncharacterized phage protein (TIGR01671 family)